jgi:hypothetical protein
MKFKKTSPVIIISAVVVAAAAVAAVLIWILPASKPVYEGDKPVLQDTGQVSMETGKENRSTLEALNINPGDINRIILIKENDGSFSTDDKGKISEILGIVNSALTASKVDFVSLTVSREACPVSCETGLSPSYTGLAAGNIHISAAAMAAAATAAADMIIINGVFLNFIKNLLQQKFILAVTHFSSFYSSSILPSKSPLI